MNILAIIPARMGSTRFPGKPLAHILGVPMIGHVYKNVERASHLTSVIVATCDEEISNYIESIGGKAVMTSSDHERATDRCAEALRIVEAEKNIHYDIVVMVQGDEPMVHPDMIVEVLQPMLNDDSIYLVNLLGAIKEEKDFEDKNCVKVVCNLKQKALYFSREPIPTRWKNNDVPMGKQVAVMAFHRDFLIKYTEMTPTPLEIIESIDMLRVLEHGYKIHMAYTCYNVCAVDTYADLLRAEKLMSNL